MTTLRAATERHQDLILARADRSADAAEAAVRRVWLALVAVMRAGGHWGQVYHGALAALRGLPAAAGGVLEDLVRAGVAARTDARLAIARHLPKAHRGYILARFQHKTGPLQHKTGLFEHNSILLEARDTDHTDPADPLLQLLPGPSDTEIRKVVFSAGWYDRLRSLTALANPEHLAAAIASGAARGLSAEALAREVRPLVQGVQTSARRVARTAGLWVAHAVEHAQYEELGDLVSGYTVHAVLDHATRPAHRARDGTTYWKHPKPGQKPMAECPHPPREADGGWAYNCRCFLSPELADADAAPTSIPVTAAAPREPSPGQVATSGIPSRYIPTGNTPVAAAGPLRDRGLPGVWAEFRAAAGRGKVLLDNALSNAGLDTDAAKPPAKGRPDARTLAGRLVSSWLEAHRLGWAAADVAPVVRALAHAGAEAVGAVGEVVPYDPALHDLGGGHARTGGRVRVTRPGWVLRGPGGFVYRLASAAVVPA